MTALSILELVRVPNLFERYSTRFGDAVPNPDLRPERAVNYQIGGNADILEGAARVGGALFYSDLRNVITSIPIGGGVVQNQNVGEGSAYGVELSGEWDVSGSLTLGGNYTYMKRRLSDPQRPDLKPVGTPEHLAYLYAHWRPIEDLTITPSVELSSYRWSSNRFEDEFTRVGGFGLMNVNVEYNLNDNTTFGGGVRNIFDRNYELADGYPEPGRTFYVNARVTF